MPLQPLFDNVLLKREEEEEKYVGTLIIPDTAKEKPMMSTIIAVGPDCVAVQVGDNVVVGRFSGADVKYKHTNYTIIREQEVLAVVTE
ncbi:MAG: co-chaperone GroES [Dehalococcoidia bacterium]|nr:MAG: co-chaperone GroES [Dehalococcoidia bacterium]